MVVEVQLLSGSWLWCWEIRRIPGGALIESSWAATWTAYWTREEAVAAGQRRLAEWRAQGGTSGAGDAWAA